MTMKVRQNGVFRRLLLLGLSLLLFAACTIHSISKTEIESVKPGSKITYRYFQNGKTWFHTDMVTRVEGDVVYYNPSVNESSSGKDTRLDDFDTSLELSIRMADLLKFENAQPPNGRSIVRID